ncbi:FMN-dependent NADH-azoreductase [Salinisphaera aquimarina]|uniref:FMN dependent NADH:quinone oxidoreductase n=1 Tax=Salinisphaera aquimarina TaxID=2094031 RepID=A0ABV7EK98_9GAMM
MRRTLFIHCSPHGEAAHGYRLAREILDQPRRCGDAATVIERDLTAAPLPPLSGDYATALTGDTAADDARFAMSESLIAELEHSDRLLISLPMHNFTVPAAFKLWIDYVVRIHRSFAATEDGKVGLLADRATTILVSSGGFHHGERAFQLDFLSPYVEHVLATIGIHDVAFHYLQGLTFGEAAVSAAVDAARDRLKAAGLLAAGGKCRTPMRPDAIDLHS